MSAYNFDNKLARHRFALILNRLALGDATLAQIALTIGQCRATTNRYVAHLEAIGQVELAMPCTRTHDGTLPALWGLAHDADVPPLPPGVTLDAEDLGPGFVRQITQRKEWAPQFTKPQSIFSILGLP